VSEDVLSERRMYPFSGWLAIVLGATALTVGAAQLLAVVNKDRVPDESLSASPVVLGVLLVALGLFALLGLVTIQPNQAVALTFFGSYRGTVAASGLRWVAPFYQKQRISIRLRTLSGDILKVNDRDGNPIEISVVIVWRVGDTAQALFGVENFQEFVAVQSESAVRELASSYHYDSAEHSSELTLRAGDHSVTEALIAGLELRLARSGVMINDARINHLAYAPEVATSMLRRQQASAVVEARSLIVSGAVEIAQEALSRLRDDEHVELAPEQQAVLISNLLVVLCGESEVTPTLELSQQVKL